MAESEFMEYPEVLDLLRELLSEVPEARRPDLVRALASVQRLHSVHALTQALRDGQQVQSEVSLALQAVSSQMEQRRPIIEKALSIAERDVAAAEEANRLEARRLDLAERNAEHRRTQERTWQEKALIPAVSAIVAALAGILSTLALAQ